MPDERQRTHGFGIFTSPKAAEEAYEEMRYGKSANLAKSVYLTNFTIQRRFPMGNDLKVNMNEYLPRDVVFNTLRQAILKGRTGSGRTFNGDSAGGASGRFQNTDPRGDQKAGAGRAGADDPEKGRRGREDLREEPS